MKYTKDFSDDTKLSPTRGHIIKVAAKLFSERGFGSTSLDLVAQEASVSKMTIFYYFRNKEGLVLAAIDYSCRVNIDLAREMALERSTNPSEYLVAVFSVLDELASTGRLDKCYIKACTEFVDPSSPERQLIEKFVREVEERVRRYVLAASGSEQEETVAKLLLLMRGVHMLNNCPGAAPASFISHKIAAEIICNAPAFAA